MSLQCSDFSMGFVQEEIDVSDLISEMIQHIDIEINININISHNEQKQTTIDDYLINPIIRI